MRDWQTVAVVAAVVVTIMGAGIVFYSETKKAGGVIEARASWIMQMLDERKERVHDLGGRVERLETYQMDKGKD